MRLTEWAKRYGDGAFTELHYVARVSFKTVVKAARDGEPVVFEVAEKLSAAIAKIEEETRLAGGPAIGVVSVDEIRFPDSCAESADSVPPGAV